MMLDGFEKSHRSTTDRHLNQPLVTASSRFLQKVHGRTFRASIIAGMLIVLLQPSLVMAATADEVEALYDRSGDQLVDAEDWKRLSTQERHDYVQASLDAFSTLNTPSGKYRIQLYLNAITNLYHYK